MQSRNEYRRGRLVRSEPDGRFYIEGVDISTLSPELYGAIWKLKNYEESGLTPDDVINLKDLYDDAVKTILEQRREIEEMRKKLVELPLRPGDTVYDCREFFNADIERPRIKKDKIFSVKILAGDSKGTYIYRTDCATYRREDFGRSVFLDEKKAHLCAEKKAREREI